ncbi:MAG: ABC transporter permease [Clostridia bacterium]
MFNYALRKLGLGLISVITVTVVLFLILHSIPGDPIRMITDPRVSDEVIEQLRARWGLDRPLYVQYFYWITNLLGGDMGTSILTHQSVAFLIGTRLPYTLMLAIGALLFQYIVGVTVGLFVAIRRGSWVDNLLVTVAVVLRSIPQFWLGILLIILFSVTWRVLPISGYDGPRSIVLPLLALALPPIASTMRLTRSEILEVMREDYVRTAHAKGVTYYGVILRHVFRNALIPVTVVFFLSLPWLIGGSVVVETVFAWPGMGRLLWRSIMRQDLPVVQAIVLIISILTVTSNTIGDIMTGFLDPRVREQMEERS